MKKYSFIKFYELVVFIDFVNLSPITAKVVY
jgi:hypothetical protein